MLVPDAPHPTLDRQLMLRIDSDVVAPLDGFAHAVRKVVPSIFKIKMPKFVAALLRVDPELNANVGRFVYLRNSNRRYGTEQMAIAGRLAKYMLRMPYYEVAQGLQTACEPP